MVAVNWKHLNDFWGPSEPKLLWLSIPDERTRIEEDRDSIPLMPLISKRREWNRDPKDDEGLLGCKAFWEAFRRAKLVIIFDRYLHDGLLKRLRDEVVTSRRRSLEMLIVFAGKERKQERAPFVKEIEAALEKAQVRFHFLPDMIATSAPFPHDRFAVTDGEFWHFGGSNLGLEMTLTAVSRGWKALTLGVRPFIEAAWAAHEERKTAA